MVRQKPKKILQEWRMLKSRRQIPKRVGHTKTLALRLFFTIVNNDAQRWISVEDLCNAIDMTAEERNEVASLIEEYVRKLRV
jgi:hypothetical protein